MTVNSPTTTATKTKKTCKRGGASTLHPAVRPCAQPYTAAAHTHTQHTDGAVPSRGCGSGRIPDNTRAPPKGPTRTVQHGSNTGIASRRSGRHTHTQCPGPSTHPHIHTLTAETAAENNADRSESASTDATVDADTTDAAAGAFTAPVRHPHREQQGVRSTHHRGGDDRNMRTTQGNAGEGGGGESAHLPTRPLRCAVFNAMTTDCVSLKCEMQCNVDV